MPSNLIRKSAVSYFFLIIIIAAIWFALGSIQDDAAFITQGSNPGSSKINSRLVDEIPNPEADDNPIPGVSCNLTEGFAPSSAATSTDTQPLPITDDAIRFAVIGDFGIDSESEARVAALISSWNPNFVITTGDNNYPDGEAATIDDNIGKYYSVYIGSYQGAYGTGSATNRFWPSLGNHDWHSISCTGSECSGAYFDYFSLPNNERYYDIDLGLVHLYALDSDSEEPDGRNSSSVQANWLKDELAASTSCYNLVYFHHAPYSSGRHSATKSMQWPFSTWGADAVFSGHDHLYERIQAYGIPYFVNGAGGAALYPFDNLGDLPPEAISVVRYNQDHGAMLVTATSMQITYQFFGAGGVLVDEFTETKTCTDTIPPSDFY